MNKQLKLTLALSLPLLLLELWGRMQWSTMGFTLLYCFCLSFALTGLNPNKLLQQTLKVVLILMYLFTLFLTFIESVIFDFTGQGFTDEFYYHISFDAFRVGFDKYGWGLLLLFALMAAIVFGLLKLTKTRLFTGYLSILAVFFTLITCSQTVTGRFLFGWHTYYQDADVVVTKKTIEYWQKNGFINQPDVPLKQLTQASAGKKNLILVYLESFNQFFIDTPPFQSLTPGLNELSKKYTNIPHQTSAYVTIEGIVSSQCGTLLTMKKGNDSMMKAEQFLANLPCMGDVLQQAGYEQHYLGGAKMEFAGKGAFLGSHGYENLMGLEYWQSQQTNLEGNVWGLGDDALFNQAFDVIAKARTQTAPFNVTLLTLGTHIPGYTYPECDGLNLNKDRFLASIQCTDHLLTKFIQRLEAANYLDDTLLMVVADHGVFPNPKMEALFGELIYDRRLAGFTNHQAVPDKQAMASYDLAPTVLDWLNIDHSTPFLFGQSINDERHNNHKHLTRYKDWHEGNLVKNSKKDCQDNDPNILSICNKEQLGHWVTQQHLRMSKHTKLATLSCQSSVTVDLTGSEKILAVDGQNLYEQFHQKGYYMKKRQFQSGWFLLQINESRDVFALNYWKIEEIESKNWQQFFNAEIENDAILIRVSEDNDVLINSKTKQQWHQQTTNTINLCL